MDILFEFLKFIWPWALTFMAVVWSLMSSRLAWWLSGLLPLGVFKRLGLALLLWAVIMIFRVYVFVRLLRCGVMPWTQIHAWRTFVKFVECYVENKSDAMIMAILAILQTCCREEIKDKEIDLYDLCSKDIFEGGCSVGAVKFLKIIFCTTQADQDYLAALMSLVGQKDEKTFWGKIVNTSMDYLRRINLASVKSDFVWVFRMVCEAILSFACEHKEREMAYNATRMLMLIGELAKSKRRNKKFIEHIIDDMAELMDVVIVQAYVFCKMNPKACSVKLLSYQPTSNPAVGDDSAQTNAT